MFQLGSVGLSIDSIKLNWEDDWKRVARIIILVSILAVALAVILVVSIYTVFRPAQMNFAVLVAFCVTAICAPSISFWFAVKRVELEKALVYVRRSATLDDLSGLLNRNHFFAKVKSRMKLPLQDASHTNWFLFIDADNFKRINDRFGHAIGDIAISQISSIIQSCVAYQDVSGRLGGEEFGIYLVARDFQSARHLAEKVRKRATGIVFGSGVEKHVLSLSIGMSEHKAGQSLEDLVSKADGSMYLAKATGRNRVVIDSDLSTNQNVLVL